MRRQHGEHGIVARDEGHVTAVSGAEDIGQGQHVRLLLLLLRSWGSRYFVLWGG